MKCELPNLSRTFLGLALAATLPLTAGGAEPLWRQLMPRKKVEADPRGDYTLTEKNGPWLIMAASFNGEGAEEDARNLVLELRQRFNLPAFYYAMTFTLDDANVGRGIDDYGGKIKRRYARGNQTLEHAVLVGEFPAIGDSDAQNLLERIKTIEPKVLQVAGLESSQSMAAVRQFTRQVKQQMGKPVTDGPMNHAFITRNPLLPKEYFTPGLDPDVAKWNEGLEFSALHCPKKYTIKVATFRGRSTLQGHGETLAEKPKRKLMQAADEPLVVAAENAHKLTVALRSRGWEAYEFHDRHESYVTVGSFDEMQQLADGRLAPATREAQIIVATFGAASPNNAFADAADAAAEQREAEVVQKFKEQFSAGMGQVSEGFYPKEFVGLPFDIQPTPIAAPKESIGSAYARR
jgi:hypothetical protein